MTDTKKPEETRVVLPGVADSQNLKNLVAEFRRD